MNLELIDISVSSISWLENDVFLMIYTQHTSPDGLIPASFYYIVTRQAQAPFLFRKLPEICAPFGLDRSPPYQFIARLRDFKPNLKDALIVCSTASTDIGLLTRSQSPLVSDVPAQDITDVFTTTSMAEDSRRAQLPLTEDVAETSAIGLGIDLSSKMIVPSPVPGEDIDDSSTPMPNVLVLNNDGVLASWWFVYSDSVRQKTPFHGLVAAGEQPQQPQQPQQQSLQATPPRTTPPAQSQTPKFGQSSFGSSTPLGQPPATSFGTPSALGSSRQPAFGSPSSLGTSSWTSGGFGAASQPSASTAGGSGFGSAATPATPAFGSTSMLGQGNRASPFGQPSALGSQSSTPGFGQPSSLGTAGGFGAMSSQPASSSTENKSVGFSSFAKPSAFGSPQPAVDSPFSKLETGQNSFSGGSGQSLLGSKPNNESSFGGVPQPSGLPQGLFGAKSNEFVLGSSFKPDGTADTDGPKPDQPSGAFSLGPAFGSMLDDKPKATSPPIDQAQAMDEEPAAKTTTPPAPSPFQAPTFTPKPMSSTSDETITAPQPKPEEPIGQKEAPTLAEENKPVPSIETSVSSPMSADTIKAPFQPATPSTPEEPRKIQPQFARQSTDRDATPISKDMETPLPPDSTSKTSYALGDTSASSSSVSKSSQDDAPLPPDFVQTKKPESPKEEVPVALPEESEGEKADFEDSGEEITHEMSAPEDTTDTQGNSFKTSPESSFGGPSEKSLAGGLFTKISANEPQQKEQPVQAQKPSKLFGEIEKPILPPPSFPPRGKSPPRSPSPVRPSSRKDVTRIEGTRSISAPGGPGSALTNRKITLGQMSHLANEAKPEDEEAQEEKRSQEIAFQAQRLAAEQQALADDDEDEQLRADLARPLSPAPTLDPFLPHQDYMGESAKPGIPGQIERLYRDINAMIDTLGINSRSLSSFLLYQESCKEFDDKQWMETLQGDQPSDILEQEVPLANIDILEQGVDTLERRIQQGKLEKTEDKLKKCHELLSKDIVSLHSQCAGIQKTIDTHTDTAATVSAPLSAEQAALQQDLRKSSTEVQSKLADLEREISLLRAKISETPQTDTSANGSVAKKKPTVEAVTMTISTMTKMAEKKSTDIDVLESRLRKLGLNPSEPANSREGSPFATPPRKGVARYPVTPGSRDSRDGGTRSEYHTPESGAHLRSSLGASGRKSALRRINGVDAVSLSDQDKWKSKMNRRKEIVTDLKTAVGERKFKVRAVDDL